MLTESLGLNFLCENIAFVLNINYKYHIFAQLLIGHKYAHRKSGAFSLDMSIEPDFFSLADETAEPRPDMNIKVAAFTVSEKSINISCSCLYHNYIPGAWSQKDLHTGRGST